MPTWPTGVPFFNAVSDAERTGPQRATLRTQMEVGPDKVRRRVTAASKRFTGRSARVTPAQLETFETWFEDDIDMGALSFDAVDPMDCATKTWRFVGTYSVRRIGTHREISAELEILP